MILLLLVLVMYIQLKKFPFHFSKSSCKTQCNEQHWQSVPSVKLTWPRKIGYPKRKVVFQPSIFRWYVSFRECNNSQQQTLPLTTLKINLDVGGSLPLEPTTTTLVSPASFSDHFFNSAVFDLGKIQHFGSRKSILQAGDVGLQFWFFSFKSLFFKGKTLALDGFQLDCCRSYQKFQRPYRDSI